MMTANQYADAIETNANAYHHGTFTHAEFSAEAFRIWRLTEKAGVNGQVRDIICERQRLARVGQAS